jgi:zinc protease
MAKSNLLLVVVGNVTRADLTAKIRAAFGSLPATGGEATRLAKLAPLQPDLLVVKEELPTNYILGVYSTPNLASPDFPAIRVATRVLSERLFEEVRTKRNLSYAVASGIGTRAENSGNLYVTAVDPDTTIKVMLSEVRKLQQEPVPVDRLKQSINVFATGLLMSQQTNMGQAATLGLWEISGGGWENGVSYVERLRKVTPAQVQQAATKYMRNARFVVIGDPTKIDRKVFIAM